MPNFPWGEDDDEEPVYPDLPGSGDEPRAVSSPDPDDALDDD